MDTEGNIILLKSIMIKPTKTLVWKYDLHSDKQFIIDNLELTRIIKFLKLLTLITYFNSKLE